MVKKSIDTLDVLTLGNLLFLEFLVHDIKQFAEEGPPRERLRLERMTRTLRDGDFKERLTGYHRIKRYYEKAIFYKHNELTKALQNMLSYYHAHILD